MKKNEIKVTVTAGELRDLFERYENLSLRRLAEALELSYPMVLKASKQPVPGEAYDPEAVNYDAIAEYLSKHEATLEGIVWEDYNNPRAVSSRVVKEISQFNVGDKVYLRKNATTPYEIIYKTETHIVIMLEGTSQPIAWGINTFMLQGPSTQPRAEKLEVAEEEA